MRVYRVGHPAYTYNNGIGEGPYNCYQVQSHMDVMRNFAWDRHKPNVSADCPGFQYGMLCGFESIEAYLDWFNRPIEREALGAAGFMLEILEVPREYVVKGAYQLAFALPAAVLVNRIPLPTRKENVLT